ncbi:MAG: 3-oxoacid CoA-transferase subunit A [Oscillospiraceae bacterium]|nr:3-oxoacid CoA-transferase subunit A [Oscillospiraceae bacterium]
MRSKVKTLAEAMEMIKDGQSIMIGGFMFGGTPEILIQGMIDKGITGITVISNDTCTPEYGIGLLIVNKRISKLISTHIGRNKETGRQMSAGETEVILVPQGTLAERIRTAGAGLGGFLTPTGVGTSVEEGKQKININGKDYLLELPLRADVALLKAWKADKSGNLVYRRAARNFNPLMATAADLVIAAAETIVEVGELDPELVSTPGAMVDVVVQA